MVKIKFYLHKFDKKLLYQLVHLDSSLFGKSYLDEESMIVVGSVSGWGSQFEFYDGGASFGSHIGRTTKTTLLISGPGLSEVKTLNFSSNELRDYYYDSIIKVLNVSIKEELWK